MRLLICWVTVCIQIHTILSLGFIFYTIFLMPLLFVSAFFFLLDYTTFFRQLQMHFYKQLLFLNKTVNTFEPINANTNFKMVEPLFGISHASHLIGIWYRLQEISCQSTVRPLALHQYKWHQQCNFIKKYISMRKQYLQQHTFCIIHFCFILAPCNNIVQYGYYYIYALFFVCIIPNSTVLEDFYFRRLKYTNEAKNQS